jgi:hypothetical protein
MLGNSRVGKQLVVPRLVSSSIELVELNLLSGDRARTYI